MYDIYDEYRATPDDRLIAMFRDHNFYSRIREFTLDGLVDVLSYVFPKDTPRPSRLVSLSIMRWVTNSDIQGAPQRLQTPKIPELLVESSSGSLRRLNISACILNIDQLPILRQLTHLSLTDFYSSRGHPTIKQMLLVLRANSGLEELSLVHRVRREQEDDEKDLPSVSFTRLRKLHITWHVRDFVPLLQHLRIVSEVEEIELKVEGYEYDRDPIPEKVSSWFNDVVPPCTVQCIETRPTPVIFRPGLKYIRRSNDIQHPNLPHYSCFVGLRFDRPSELSAFLALETLCSATRLELIHSNLSPPQYLQIFEMVPMLQELVTWVGQECNSVYALLPTTLYSQGDVQDSTCVWHIPLRNLSCLRIIGADLGNTEDEDGSTNEAAISNLVRQRKLLGFGLRRLELVYCQYVLPGWVDGLRRFVPEISWDGEGGVGTYLDDSDGDYSSLDDSGPSESDWESISQYSDEDIPTPSSH